MIFFFFFSFTSEGNEQKSARRNADSLWFGKDGMIAWIIFFLFMGYIPSSLIDIFLHELPLAIFTLFFFYDLYVHSGRASVEKAHDDI